MNPLHIKAFRSLAILFLVTAAVLFGAAGTLAYWLIWRLADEERFLVQNLPGYRQYRQMVRYWLLPFVW